MVKKKVSTFKKLLLKTGQWIHPKDSSKKFTVTKDVIQKLKDNFGKSPFAPILRTHDEKKAEENPDLIINKNISGLEIGGNGTKLYGKLNLKEEEVEKYNDVSCGINPNGRDHKTGKMLGHVLNHVMLTVNPYIKTLGSFTKLTESKNNLLINLSDIMDKDTKTEVEEESTEEEAPEASETKEKTTTEDSESKEDSTAELAETSKLQAQKIVELEEKVAKQEAHIALREAEAKYSTFLKAGKITPAQKEPFINLCTASSSVIELSDGSETDVKTLVDELFEKAPKIIEFSERGVDTESAEKEEKLKLELKERRPELTDKQFEKVWEKHGRKAKAHIKKG